MGTGPFAKAGNRLPIGSDAASVRQRVEVLEQALERMFVIPGINRPVGIDTLLGLLPVGGSFIGAAFGGYMIWEARNLGMGKGAMARMAGNVGLDWLFGLIPGIGIIPDFFFRSNTRNLRIIRKHLDKHHPSTVVVEG
ncbi:DUF4112 domain-containing protein [Sphingomonas qomolangmaensis]|uniref:DUF4112 domain-containing protein n=1 Tax=Sphingomonas qomolangmaensis TaxID=2918765 RepID=A0ABY5LA65_9SPHN|nr:DUF4112 domain-containing protein [Sphingomonas qomolangmaensis]UUL83855.1 DUF4112 domain-containing protein [Sphingomonas qomolangmaensis]